MLIIGGGDVHELPANMSPTRSRPPGENLGGIGPLGDRVERVERQRPAERGPKSARASAWPRATRSTGDNPFEIRL